MSEENLTPSELNRQVRSLLESHYDYVWITGEVSNFAAPSSGHWYFSLKDDSAQVRCAMFRNRNQRLRFRPTNGDAVRLRARVSLYEGRGEFQLIGEFLEPAGAGALQARFEALRDKLRDEGLFDNAGKKPLPPRIEHIAVITSPTGAALQDILTVLKRRSPVTRITVIPSAVQGDGAAPQLCAALGRANAPRADSYDFDAILLARGGGSLEDLWAFNEESVARAIAASELPVVCGVGHEVDVTIADFAADLRAPTPSAAAELLSTDLEEVLGALGRQQRRLRELMLWRLQRLQSTVTQLQQRLRHPGTRLREQSQRLDDLELQLKSAVQRRLAAESHRHALLRLRMQALSPSSRLAAAQRQLKAHEEQLRHATRQRLLDARQTLQAQANALRTLNPLAILERGYAILTRADGRVVRSSANVSEGDHLRARLGRGEMTLEVLEPLDAPAEGTD